MACEISSSSISKETEPDVLKWWSLLDEKQETFTTTVGVNVRQHSCYSNDLYIKAHFIWKT